MSTSPLIIEQAQKALGAAPQPLRNTLGHIPAADRARSVVTSLYATSQGLPGALDWASRIDDPNLSPEGIKAATADRRQAIAEVLKGRMATVTPHLVESIEQAEAAAEPFYPKLNESDVAQGNRITSAWQHSVLPQHEAGKSWDAIISTLDHDGILAVKRFAPTIEASKRSARQQSEMPGVIAEIDRIAERRVMDSAPEGPARDAFRQLEAARAQSDAATIALQNLSYIADAAETGDGYALQQVGRTTIAIKRAAHAVGADPATVAQSTAAAA